MSAGVQPARQVAMPSSRRDRGHARRAIAGQQLDGQPAGAQRRDHPRGIGAQRIVEGEAHGRAARPRQPELRPIARRAGRFDAAPGAAAQAHLARRRGKAQAAARHLLDTARCRHLRQGARDRARERVTARAGERGSHAQRLGIARLRARQRGSPAGQRAGLVEHHGIDLGETLQRRRRLQQHAPAQQTTRCDHLHRRHGEPERARAGDDQHRHRVEQRDLPGGTRKQGPPEERRKRQAVHRGGVQGGEAIGQHHVPGAPLLRELHQAHDLGEQRAFPDRGDLEPQRRVEVQGAGEHPIARADRGAAPSRR